MATMIQRSVHPFRIIKKQEMKKELHLIKNIFGISAILLFSSCRSADSENTLTGSGSLAVSFNLVGAEYAYPGKLPSQASLGKRNMSNSENKIQRHSVLVAPGSLLTAELSPSVEVSKVSLQASVGMNSVVAASGNSLTSGTKFRVIAYRKSDGSYHTHQDYTIGQAAIPMMLDNGIEYNIVVYSYGTTNLPDISSDEQNNLSNAVVNYDDTNRDFMYQNLLFTPVNSNNTLNITLRHKVAQITTIVRALGLGDITNITGGVLKPHYNDGIISLSTGTMSGRSTTSSATLDFPSSGFPGLIQTSSPVFVNADTSGNATGVFSADITIGGITKTINLSNYFKITPENKSNLTISMLKCGAYIGPQANPSNYKEFMCHNLGADTNADPFTPSAAIHGAKYQWGAQTGEYGRYSSQSESGNISGWVLSDLPDGTWRDTNKTAKDPCPTGYRVPTRAQWESVISNNDIERVGSWNTTNYTSALYLKDSSGIRSLMLPASGTRGSTGILSAIGTLSVFWSSSSYPGPAAWSSYLVIDSSTAEIKNNYRSIGMSVRCIAE